jgi:hypothetical protein
MDSGKLRGFLSLMYIVLVFTLAYTNIPVVVWGIFMVTNTVIGYVLLYEKDIDTNPTANPRLPV